MVGGAGEKPKRDPIRPFDEVVAQVPMIRKLSQCDQLEEDEKREKMSPHQELDGDGVNSSGGGGKDR